MSENTKTKLAIFDLDGTLFNTDDVNYLSYKEALEPFGIELDREYFVGKCNGRSYKDFLPVIMGDSKDIETVHDSKMNLYTEYLPHAKKNEHLIAMMNGMKDEYYLALVTTASKKNTKEITDYFGITDMFDLCLTKEDIKKTKPDPEGFLAAMEFFNVSAKDTVIFEDSDVGIEAARRAGATVFAVDKF